ncbi:MAG: NADH:flavin oxidoreductase/NADH oxidase family protein, partial [Chthoniobacterales bacterium]
FFHFSRVDRLFYLICKAMKDSLTNQPIKIGSLEIKNRLFKPAMSEQLADKYHNPKGELLGTLYHRWSQGGIGMMITGNIMVDQNALGEPSNVVLDEHSDLAAFRTWIKKGRANGTRIFAQLNHPGKQVPKFLDSQPMAPSPIPIQGPLAAGFNPPREMTSEDIQRVIGLFAQAASLSKEVGFDGIELHGAHGYLINQFLSPKHNQRKDEWAEPTKFILAVYHAVRAAVGDDYPVIIKLNSSDFEKGGYSEDDAIKVMLEMEKAGIDAIEVSGGTYEAQVMMGEGDENVAAKPRGGYFLKFARGAKTQLKIPVFVTGGFRSHSHVLQALEDGVDMVGIGRALVLEPDFPNKIMAGEEGEFQNDIRRSCWAYLNTISQLSWWESQMLRIATGEEPDPELHIARAAWHAFTHVGIKAFAPRRG